MNKSIALLAFSALPLVSQAAIKIVTTTPDLGSIAMAVGGSRVSVSPLVVGARDPHRIEAKPSYMSRVGSADLFIAVGLELEVAYEGAILEGSRNRKVQPGVAGHLYASDSAIVLERPTGTVTRAMGDIHPHGNPHIWLDPLNGRRFAEALSTKLSGLDPAGAKDYQSNLGAFEKRLDTAMFGQQLVAKFGGDKLWGWEQAGLLEKRLQENGASGIVGGWQQLMANLRGAPILTYHRSLSYLANRFGLRVVDELEPKPGLEPSPGHLVQVISTAKSAGVKVILQESFYNPKHAQMVASRIGAKVVVIPQNVGHDPAATDYITLFDTIVSRVAGAVQ